MRYITDSGFLIALLDKSEQHHPWAVGVAGKMKPPFYTCEAVLTETSHLLRKSVGLQGVQYLFEFIRNGTIHLDFDAALHIDRIMELMQKYHDIPMDFADACLVVMTEQERYSACEVLTIDSDFRAYRRHSRQIIPAQLPSK